MKDRSRFWPTVSLLLAVYAAGFALIRINSQTMLSGNGVHQLMLPRILFHSSMDWKKPWARAVVALYDPLFQADMRLTKRLYCRGDLCDYILPW